MAQRHTRLAIPDDLGGGNHPGRLSASETAKEAARGQITAELLRRFGMPYAARHVETAGHNLAVGTKKLLLHEPSWTPGFLKGKHILPKKVVHGIADAVADHGPALVLVEAMPIPGSGAAYLAAHRGVEKALGIPKLAALKTQLQPHQQRVVDKIKQPDQPGLVVAHGLGSGKTLAAIAAQDELQMPAGVVLPAALRANFVKEQDKHILGERPETDIVSLEQAARNGAPPKAPLLVVDEAHRARTPGTKTNKALKANEAEKRLLLTGSPFYNHPVDIAPLVNIASGESTLPESKQEFAGRYVRERQVKPGFIDRTFRGLKPGVVEELNPKKRGELGDILGKWVDYHPSSRKGFPKVTEEDIEVPMDARQLRLYDAVLGEAPPWVAAKIRRGLPPSKQEAKELNSFMSGVRQVSNTTRAFENEDAPEQPVQPKIERAFAELQRVLEGNPRAKAAVYSNWLDSGIKPYRDKLIGAGIPFGEFTGEMNRRERDELVKKYNAGELRALLLSSAGGEGLDLKGTRLLQVLDPHWNEERGRQVIGRGARYLSHAELPEDEQEMHVQRFLSTRPKKGVLEHLGLKKPGYAADQYLTQLSADKARLNKGFTELLEEYSQRPAAANTPTSSLHKAASADPLGLTKEQREARRRADAHFKSDDPGKWQGFVKNVRRKSFSNAVQADPRADEKLQRHTDQMNRMLTGKTLDHVKGAGGTYRIVQLRGSDTLGCTCGDWRFKRSVAPDGEQDCKHIKEYRMRSSILGDIKVAMFGPEAAEAHRQQRSAAMHEVAGLGVLAAPSAANLGAMLPGRAGQIFKPIATAIGHGAPEHAIELAGLGILAKPSIQELRQKPAQQPKVADFEDEHGTGGPAQGYISTADHAAWRARSKEAGTKDGDGSTLGRDKDGFYCHTQRARSKSYPSVAAIPLDVIRKVGRTG